MIILTLHEAWVGYIHLYSDDYFDFSGWLHTPNDGQQLVISLRMALAHYHDYFDFTGGMGWLHTARDGQLLVVALCTSLGDGFDSCLRFPLHADSHSIRGRLTVHEGQFNL